MTTIDPRLTAADDVSDPFISDDGGDDDPPGMDRPVRRRGPRLASLLALGACVLFFAYVVWQASVIGRGSDVAGDIPLIQADRSDIRVAPEDPGGMDIRHQDKTVYDRLESQPAEPTVERLLPPPEEPVLVTPPPPPGVDEIAVDASTPPAAPGGETSDVAISTLDPTSLQAPPEAATTRSADVVEAVDAAGVPTPPARPAPAQVAATAPVPAPAAAQSEASAPVTPPAATAPAPAPRPTTAAPAPQSSQPASQAQAQAVPVPVPAAAAPAANASGPVYRVQLASFRARDVAEGAWVRSVARVPDLLEGLQPDILQVDLGDRGIYYRLRAGPLPALQDADQLCTALKARGLDCLVVER